MATLTIVANVAARADRIDLVKAELENLIPIARADLGCFQYGLHRDDGDPAHFLFYNNRESRDLWRAHINAPLCRPSCKRPKAQSQNIR